MRFAIVNQDNVVVNVIIWGGAEFLPPRNHRVVQNDSVDLGDIYNPDDNTFSRPQPQPEEPQE